MNDPWGDRYVGFDGRHEESAAHERAESKAKERAEHRKGGSEYDGKKKPGAKSKQPSRHRAPVMPPMMPPPGPPQGGPPGMMMDGKMEKTMHEFEHGELHSGSKTGPKVTSRKQAIAIGMSQARKAGEKV